jgi:hypothetical protein
MSRIAHLLKIGGKPNTVDTGQDYPLPVGPRPAEWSEVPAAADNLAVTATRAAVAGKSHYVTGFSASFSAAVAGKLLELKDGATVIWRGYVHNERDIEFQHPRKITAGAAASLTLAASGTAAVLGAVTLHGYTAD